MPLAPGAPFPGEVWLERKRQEEELRKRQAAQPATEPFSEPPPGYLAELGKKIHALTAGPPAPANWYADPYGRHAHRWWDGTEWTQHVLDNGVQSTDGT
jgi:Protein of unknown function (DUF2510)